MCPRSAPSFVFLAFLFTATTALAQEWTRFRGPAGQGIGRQEEGKARLPASFSKQNVLWRVPVGGKGHSSPVLWGKKLFLTREGEQPGEREVVCFDAVGGKELWAYEDSFEPHKQHRLNSFAASTPAVDDAGVYLAWSSGGSLHALAVDHDGKRIWQQKLGAFRAQHGSGASPILFKDLVIVANDNEGGDNFLVALSKAKGEERWKIRRRSSRQGAYSSPMIYRPKEGPPCLLFTSTSHGLTAVDPEKGKVLWEWNPNFRRRCVNVPCVSGDLLYYSTGSGASGKECAFVRLPQDADSKPEPQHEQRRRAIPYVPSAIAIEGSFYLFNDGGIATCLDAGTGKQTWRQRMDGTFFSSPVAQGRTIYIADREGTLFCVAAGKEFKLLGSMDLGEPVQATPAIALGRMYVRTAGHLICLGQPQESVGTEKGETGGKSGKLKKRRAIR